uniref:Uncharacterized protein n=1 Tax=Anguilla anguilla TaxID=7936 RepID=A0A0E9VUW6_ANGAN
MIVTLSSRTNKTCICYLRRVKASN